MPLIRDTQNHNEIRHKASWETTQWKSKLHNTEKRKDNNNKKSNINKQ